jgi:hypothetical protein
MFRIDPAVHAKAALAAQLSGKSLNQWAEEALRDAADRKLNNLRAASCRAPSLAHPTRAALNASAE